MTGPRLSELILRQLDGVWDGPVNDTFIVPRYALQALAERTEAALAIHVQDGPTCANCTTPYPCPTAIALGIKPPGENTP